MKYYRKNELENRVLGALLRVVKNPTLFKLLMEGEPNTINMDILIDLIRLEMVNKVHLNKDNNLD